VRQRSCFRWCLSPSVYPSFRGDGKVREGKKGLIKERGGTNVALSTNNLFVKYERYIAAGRISKGGEKKPCQETSATAGFPCGRFQPRQKKIDKKPRTPDISVTKWAKEGKGPTPRGGGEDCRWTRLLAYSAFCVTALENRKREGKGEVVNGEKTGARAPSSWLRFQARTDRKERRKFGARGGEKRGRGGAQFCACFMRHFAVLPSPREGSIRWGGKKKEG